MDPRRYQRNIPILYLIITLHWSLFSLPVLIPFYLRLGLSLSDVFLLQSLFSLAIGLLEVPSGFISDLVSRKHCLALGAVIDACGVLLLAMSSTFWQCALAQLLMALGSSLISGIDSALLFESLKAAKAEGTYVLREGRLIALTSLAEAAAGIVGGYLAAWDLLWPFYVRGAVVFAAGLLSLLLAEPPREKLPVQQRNLGGMLRITQRIYFREPFLRALMFFGASSAAFSMVAVWALQPLLAVHQVPLQYYGVLWALFQLPVVCASLMAARIEKQLSTAAFLRLIVWLPAIAYLFAGHLGLLPALVLFSATYFARGLRGPVFKRYLQEAISSDQRATVLSVYNMTFRLLFALIGPLVGWLADALSLATALSVTGVASLCAVLPWLGVLQDQINAQGHRNKRSIE